MRYGTYKFIEDIVTNFEKYPEYLDDCRAELSHTKRPEQIKREYEQLKREQAVIQSVLEGVDPIVREMIELYYFPRLTPLTWHGVSAEVGYSRHQCLRLRDRVFSEIASGLGMV